MAIYPEEIVGDKLKNIHAMRSGEFPVSDKITLNLLIGELKIAVTIVTERKYYESK